LGNQIGDVFVRRRIAIAAILWLAVEPTPFARGQVVYDSMSSQSTHGYGGVHEAGQEITLAGTARTVTKFEFQCSCGSKDVFLVRFYKLDGPLSLSLPKSNEPGTIIWESPLQIGNQGVNRVVEVPVPAINVPDTFAWAIANPDLDHWVGIDGGLDGVSVGTKSWEWIKRRTDYPPPHWGRDTGLLGARITAIPEPSTAALMLIAATAFGMRQRRRCKS
jgi:hypothetical protein